MTVRKRKNLEGRNLFEKFRVSQQWISIEISCYENTIYGAIFKNIISEKFVFIDVSRSNSGKTEYWTFDEFPTGGFILKLFKASKDWEEVESTHESARNDYDSRSQSQWFFKDKKGNSASISSRSINRNGNKSTWTYDGDIRHIPDFSVLDSQV